MRRTIWLLVLVVALAAVAWTVSADVGTQTCGLAGCGLGNAQPAYSAASGEVVPCNLGGTLSHGALDAGTGYVPYNLGGTLSAGTLGTGASCNLAATLPLGALDAGAGYAACSLGNAAIDATVIRGAAAQTAFYRAAPPRRPCIGTVGGRVCSFSPGPLPVTVG